MPCSLRGLCCELARRQSDGLDTRHLKRSKSACGKTQSRGADRTHGVGLPAYATRQTGPSPLLPTYCVVNNGLRPPFLRVSFGHTLGSLRTRGPRTADNGVLPLRGTYTPTLGCSRTAPYPSPSKSRTSACGGGPPAASRRSIQGGSSKPVHLRAMPALPAQTTQVSLGIAVADMPCVMRRETNKDAARSKRKRIETPG